jgi:glycolate oxidase FAD binding subunit
LPEQSSRIEPQSPAELADALAASAAQNKSIQLGDPKGVAADVAISTSRMTRVLQYEPRDLTISVEAGITYAELSRILAENQQMIPLDPPWSSSVTIAGLLAANLNGPRRRSYGTGRDLVIGMTFATLEGKLVQTGGMVVKNVAGLDMGKLMIGSFGTLAGIATVNFKLNPIPKVSATFDYEFASAADAFAMRDRVLKGQLQPAALDILNPAASERAGLSKAWNVLMLSVAMPERFEREFPGGRMLPESAWEPVREFTASWLAANPNAVIARCSTTHKGMKQILTDAVQTPAIARAASGIVYLYDPAQLPKSCPYVLEFAPAGTPDRWPQPGSSFDVMQRIKQMFDPKGLLNKGALYGRI